MGHYSRLSVGPVGFSWKYHVPTVLTLLFDDAELFSVPYAEGTEEAETGWLQSVGWSTTCAKSKNRLDAAGFTLPFFAEVYSSFHSELEQQLRLALSNEFAVHCDESAIDKRVDAHLAQFEPQPRVQDLRDFAAFIAECLRTKFRMPQFDDTLVEMGFRQSVREKPDLGHFESLQMLLLDRATLFPPAVVKVASFFEEDYLSEYPEVVLLMYCRVLLEAVHGRAKIMLDLADVVESEDEARDLYHSLAPTLIKKVQLYNRVFGMLADQEVNLRQRYAKSEARTLMSDLTKKASPHEKGRILEGLMTATFTSHPELEVVESRYSTGDEEIDLVVKNSLEGGFWTGLSSPLLFIECKNWTRKVGARELRDFEVKLQNHRPLVRVGLMVSTAGFSTEAKDELKRISRDYYTIATAGAEDIRQLLDTDLSLPVWLERLICRPV